MGGTDVSASVESNMLVILSNPIIDFGGSRDRLIKPSQPQECEVVALPGCCV